MESTRRWKIAARIGVCAAVPSFVLGIAEFGRRGKCKQLEIAQAIILAGWVLVPPIWFCAQYFWDKPVSQETLDQYKYEQELASKVWLAVVSVLAFLYFGSKL